MRPLCLLMGAFKRLGMSKSLSAARRQTACFPTASAYYCKQSSAEQQLDVGKKERAKIGHPGGTATCGGMLAISVDQLRRRSWNVEGDFAAE